MGLHYSWPTGGHDPVLIQSHPFFITCAYPSFILVWHRLKLFRDLWVCRSQNRSGWLVHGSYFICSVRQPKWTPFFWASRELISTYQMRPNSTILRRIDILCYTLFVNWSTVMFCQYLTLPFRKAVTIKIGNQPPTTLSVVWRRVAIFNIPRAVL